MKATILFPGDYFSLNSPNDNFSAELDAVVARMGWKPPSSTSTNTWKAARWH